MKIRTILAVVLVAVGVVRADEEIKTDEGVIVLTKGNYAKVLEDNQHVLVEFCKFLGVFFWKKTIFIFIF